MHLLSGALLVAVALMAAPVSGSAQSAGSGSSRDAAALPETIPLFPLPDVALFPNVTQPLHIFEPRYRAMVAEALAGDGVIGMVMLRPGYEADYEGNPPVYSIGCAGTIESFEQLPDGGYNIVLRGIARFRIESEDTSRPYRLARVETLPEELSDDDLMRLSQRRDRVVELFLSIAPNGQAPPPTLSDEDLVNTLSQFLPLEPEDRQALLEAEGALARAEALIELLESMQPLRRA